MAIKKLSLFLTLTAIAVAGMLGQSALGAEEPAAAATSLLSFSGFGTVGVAHSSEERADYVSNTLKTSGAGYSREWISNVDTILGAQMVLSVTPQLSATLQVVSEQGADKTYAPRVEWANIKYQFTPDFSVRVGRTLLANFLFSDSRKVGYANVWVRPPVEAYNLVPVTSSDGVDATYRLQAGRFSHTIVGLYGNFTNSAPEHLGGGDIKARDLWLLSDTIEYGALTLRLAVQGSTTDIESVTPLFDALRQFGPQGVALAEEYGIADKSIRFIGVGAMYDPGKWFAIGEWGNTEFHSVVGNRTAWYVSGGYRHGKFTPYVTYSEATSDSAQSDPGLDLALLPPFLAPTAAGLNYALNGILGSLPLQRTVAVGMRWDVFKSASLKLQYDHINLGAGSAGTLINVQPDFQRGGSLDLVSIAVDFVL